MDNQFNFNHSEYGVNNDSALDKAANMLYHELYGNVEGKVVLYSSLFLTSIIGPALSMGIILFEQFGGDRQKRTIMNRLLSCTLINLALLSIHGGILRIVRDCYGLLPFGIMLWDNFFVSFLRANTLLFYIELSFSRYLYIVIWKRLRAINDDFWSAFLVLSTIMVSFAVASYSLMAEEDPNRRFPIIIARHRTERNISPSER